MGVPKPKSAQKCRFCARRASQNSTERLSGARNSTERPGAAGNSHSKRDKTAWNEAQQPEAQRNATSTKRNRNATNTTHATQHNTRNATQHTQRNTMQHTQRNRSVTHNATATQLHNGEQQKRRQPFGLSPLKIGGYLLSHMVVQYHRRK